MTVTLDKQTARTRDLNGYLQVSANPISKTGVYDYLGSEIAGHDLPPNQIYKVYRPAEELGSQEAIDSFKLMPLVDDHEVLGDNATAPERKGMHGYLGQDVHFDDPYLRGTIMIPSRAAQGLIESGKIELSPAYRCVYEKKSGTFEGQPYDFIQRDIRGNHLALVAEGRTGPDVAVLDHRTITLDMKRLRPMEFTEEQIAQLKALILETLAAQQAAVDEKKDEPAADAEAETEAPAADVEVATVEQKDAAEETLAVAEEASTAIEAAAEALEEVELAAAEVVAAPTADSKAKLTAAKAKLKLAQDGVSKAMAKRQPSMDSLRAELIAVRKQLAKPVAKPAEMTADAMLDMIADRDALASKVSQFIGSFDHARMTADGVAKYACEKVGLKPVAGSERIALDAWLHGRKPESARVVAQDRRATGESIDKLWESK